MKLYERNSEHIIPI